MDGFTLSGAARAPALQPAPAWDRFSPSRPLHVQQVAPPPSSTAAPPYLVHLASISTPNPTLLAVSHPSLLTLIDKATATPLHSLNLSAGHRITQAHALPQSSGASGFILSSTDGTVSSYDTRSSASLAAPAIVLRGSRNTPFLSVAASPHPSNHHLVAAGTELTGVDAHVEIYDVRSPAAPVFRYTESHSDDVTSLRFHPLPEHADILLTGSTDGLVCAVDTTVQDEDDAVIAVGNTRSSVARAGWGGGDQQSWARATAGADVDMATDRDEDLMQREADVRRRGLGSVWAVGDMQTLSTWDADKFDPLFGPADVRSSTCLRPSWATDYIIDAHCASHLHHAGTAADPSIATSAFTRSASGVTLYAGAISGAFSVLTASPEAAGGWRLEAIFPEATEDGSRLGHNDIVRCVDYDPASRILYSGGEDGRLCMWRISADDCDSVATSPQLVQQTQLVAAAEKPAALAGGRSGGFGEGAMRSGARGTSESGSARNSPRGEAGQSSRNHRWKPYG